MKRGRQDQSAFTLVELLVVIVIIMILAGLILTAIHKAREKGRQANCVSNLHQISLALTLYSDDHQEQGSPWLSALFPKYMPGRTQVLICKSDGSQGADGSKPNSAEYSALTGDSDQYPETDDIASNTDTNRNKTITACSYMYELCCAECGWTGWQASLNVGVPAVDKNGDNKASWAEVKDYQLKHGDKSQTDGPKPYDPTSFPIVRCFHHYKERRIGVIDASGKTVDQCMTLNVFHDGHVDQAALYWELVRAK
jgi:type II secretory pathway pseudopilin PulG